MAKEREIMSRTRLSSASRPGAFYGWRVVGAAFIVAIFGWGLGFYGPSVYLMAVTSARGLPIPEVSLAVTIHFLAGAGLATQLPRLHRRFGVPVVTIGGAVVLAIGVVGWALASNFWQLVPAALLTGVGWVPMGAIGVNAIVSPWFKRRRSKALALAYNGASVGGIIFPPLLIALLQRTNFLLMTLCAAILLVFAITAISIIVLRHTPQSLGQLADNEQEAPARAESPDGKKQARKLWRDMAFLTLATGMSLGLFAQIGLIAHLTSMLTPPLGAQGAGLAVGLATGSAILGRTFAGWLRITGHRPRLVAGASLLVQSAGCATMITATWGGAPALLLGLILIGLGIGNATSIPPTVAQKEFAPADVPRVVALVVATSQCAYSFAPVLFGLIREVGPPPVLFVCALLIQVVAAGAYFAGETRAKT